MDAVTLLTLFVLAVFVGFEVVSKVSSTLHTPLMSGANAIHGIILVGAVIVAGQASNAWVLVASLIAVLLATINLVGGFVVTDRMLEMFGGRKAGRQEARRRASDAVQPRGHRGCSTWSPPSASSSPSRASARRAVPAAATSSAPRARSSAW